MTQQNNATNWVIQGANGQPQVIKLVQPAGKSISGFVTSTVGGHPVKILKSSPTSDSSQAFSTSGTSNQIIRTITTTPKFVTAKSPVQVSGIPKGTKTIRLTPSQMQNFKFVQTSPKIQQIQLNQTPTSVGQPSPSHANQKTISPPILSRKRQDPLDLEFMPDTKRRKPEKVGKGLRHFSMKVCEKVRKKGTTTYNEVADELVGEFTSSASGNSLADQYDQKNIRRRVYDALNVLMAMNIISKEKKEIRWIGLPTNSLQECIQLEREKLKKITAIKEKKKQLKELILNQIAFKSLVQRNKLMEERHGQHPQPSSYIQLPFLTISANKKTEIECSVSRDKLEYIFRFNDKFEINDDVEVLKSIGMLMDLDTGKCTPENLEKIRNMVPQSLEEYVNEMAFATSDGLENILDDEIPGTSSMLTSEDLVEATLDEENSHQSSSDPLSPSAHDFSEDEGDSDTSSDIDLN